MPENLLEVAASAALRALSWILGFLDTVYLHLVIRHSTTRFFEDGYGDLAEELRLQTFIRGTVRHPCAINSFCAHHTENISFYIAALCHLYTSEAYGRGRSGHSASET